MGFDGHLRSPREAINSRPNLMSTLRRGLITHDGVVADEGFIGIFFYDTSGSLQAYVQ